MLLVYCEYSTPRIEYIFQFILHTLCGLDFRITTDELEYRQYEGATLNYSHTNLRQNDIEIKPNGLLFLETITNCSALVKQEGEIVHVFLKATDVDVSLFDLFAASFYLLSRYEEYLPYTPDSHNRFEASSSILFHYRLLHRPLINEWAEQLKQTFSKAHTGLTFQKRGFTCKISIDIDQAFAFRHRGMVKSTFALFKNLASLNTSFLKTRLQATILNSPDPYDTFSYLHQVQQAVALPFIYFVNMGTQTKYDKNVPSSNKQFYALLNQLKTHAELGLHPSYFSDIVPEKVKVEKETLETTINQSVTQSRQHYLKLCLPDTYRQLIATGITEDYTMGFASYPGFRAATCTPFLWFDLQKNKTTALTVFPITYMEGTFGEDLAMPPQQALEAMRGLIDTVRRYKGCLIPIWHNHTVNDRFFWKDWKSVFEESLHYIAKR